MRPLDLPPADRYRHGTRSRYVSGCRCSQCRESNRLAYHERQKQLKALALEVEPGPPTDPVTTAGGRTFKRGCPGLPAVGSCFFGSYLRKDSTGGICSRCRESLNWNGLVPAGQARAHLLRLRRSGVGRRAVGAASDVGDTILQEILSKAKTQIRADTERRILAVSSGARADAALVPAGPTWKILDDLLARGFTKTYLGARLGSAAKIPSLQVRRGQILARTALAVAKLARTIGDPPAPNIATRDTAWSPADGSGLQKHLTCRGRGCRVCHGEGYRRSRGG